MPTSDTNSPSQTTFDPQAVRARFPALQRDIDGQQPIFFDNPAGTQVPQAVIDAVSAAFLDANANLGGAFETSRRADRLLIDARAAMADFFNAPSPETIVFGANMTTLTFAMSRALGKTFKAGDEIIVTRMDHDGNVAPWLRMAEDHDLVIKWVDFDPVDCLLDLPLLERHLSGKTRLVAVSYASNATGTLNNVQRVTELAHKAGALVYVDAVHYGPHGPIDVQALGCDFLVASPYKFFAPHLGVLYGKRDLLQTLPAYKVRPASDAAPDRWETGTQPYELLAGLTAAIEYLAWVGQEFGKPFEKQYTKFKGQRLHLKTGMAAIAAYERILSQHMLEGLASIKGIKVYGLTDIERLDERVPTFIFSMDGKTPRQITAALGKSQIFTWDGDYYALEVMRRLGVAETGGLVRVGPVHYNTTGEIDTFIDRLKAIAKTRVSPDADTKPGMSTEPFKEGKD